MYRHLRGCKRKNSTHLLQYINKEFVLQYLLSLDSDLSETSVGRCDCNKQKAKCSVCSNIQYTIYIVWDIIIPTMLQSNAAAGNVSHTGPSGAAGAARGRQRRIHGQRGRPPSTLVTQTLFLASVHHGPSSPPICHLPPKNLFHSMSQAQPLLVLMALSAEPPNPITF